MHATVGINKIDNGKLLIPNKTKGINNLLSIMKLKLIEQEYVIIFVAIFFIALISYRIYYTNEIDKNPISTIGKVYDISITKYTVHNVKFKYYYNGKLYTGIHRIDSGKDSLYLGNYYEVIISKNDPKKNKIILRKQILDSIKIKDFKLRI